MKKIILTLACLLPLVSFGGITVGSSLPPGVVTNITVETNIISWTDPYHAYATGAGVADANGVYTWAGFGATTNGLSATWDKLAIQNYSPAWTNESGFMIWRSYDVTPFYSDFVLTKTNVDRSVGATNVYYALGFQTTNFGFEGQSQFGSHFNMATTWNNLLNDMQYDGLPNYQAADFPTIKFGTNTITNIAVYASSDVTNSKHVWLDANNGDDSRGNLAGYPFRTIQAADAVTKLHGGGFTWTIYDGSYDLTGWTWFPTNATVWADKNAIIWNQNKNISTTLVPNGDFECHGGYFYQPPGYGFNGPYCLFSPYTTSLKFIDNTMLTDMGCVQGLIGTQPLTQMRWVGCDYSSGSYAIELQASAANRIEAHIEDTIIRENSWNPSLSGIGLICVFLQYADCYMTGGSLILSNSFTSTEYPSAAVGVKLQPTTTNTLHLAGVTMYFNKGTNSNYIYIDATNTTGSQKVYLYGTSYNTNRMIGSFTNSPP